MTEVLVLFGSKSDEACYKNIIHSLKKKKISYDLKIASAHKTPDDVDNILKKDYKVIISGAGLSAALPGVAASKTLKPVIGVPCHGNYQGLDALLSIMQMPPGIPVLGVGVEKTDIAANSAINILKKYEKVVLVGDKNTKAFKKAEEIFKKFNINHAHSTQISDDAINISFVYFNEEIEKKEQLIFELMKEESKFSDEEMYKTLNMGMGFFIICNKDDADKILQTANGGKIVGEVKKSNSTRTVLEKGNKNIVFEGY